MAQKGHLPPLVAIFLISFGLHLFNLTGESLWRDEVDSIRFAAESWEVLLQAESPAGAAGELVSYLTRPGWNGPLYFWVLELWLRLAGRSELALRLPSALAGLTVAVLCYSLGARLFARPVGRLAALLAGVNPYLAWYAGEGKMYTLITALALLSTYLLLRALEQGGTRYWLGYIAVTTALFYTHILTPLLLPVQVLLALLIYPRAALSRPALLSAGAIIFPYVPLLLWQWPHLVQPAETGFAFAPLHEMARRLGEVFSRGVIGWSSLIPLLLLLGAVGVGLALAEIRVGVALLGWAAVPILELGLVSLRRPLFTERYLIWTLPAWWIMAAAGLGGLAQRGTRSRRLALIWSAGLAAVGLVGIGYQWSTPVRADFRSATAYVRDYYRPEELIVFQIPYLQATFDYYAPDLDYRAAGGPYTNWGDAPQQVAAVLQGTTAGHQRVWLVLSEAPMWDSRGLTLEWFRAHGQLLQGATFNRVEVTLWDLGGDGLVDPASP